MSHQQFTDAAMLRRALRMTTYAECLRDDLARAPGRSSRELWLFSAALWRVVADLCPEKEIRDEH